ncbi:MAG: methyltransferase domain-containing protein, partial [bacterium]|nr:methyltransferase domain-containing protein [bacterium]
KKAVNILSAGCSSGEEAYTLSIILREKFPGLSFNIFGIDISDLVIAKGNRAEYTQYAVRFVPPNYQKKYFEPLDSGNFKFRDEFKNGVRFKKLNLMELGDTSTAMRFDVVFCRYVLIYFDKESKQKVVTSFYEKIADNGYLILGNSESLFSISSNFKMLHFPSAIIYNRRH